MGNRKNVFTVLVTISNKEFLKDPEGETILNDLILKENYTDFVSVRSARSFTIQVKAENESDAVEKVRNMCDDLRMYNPVVSQCNISIETE
jgi:phosphoribosylformylglycinamidine synthase